MNLKTCPTCKQEKSLNLFNSQGKYCKECHNAKNRDWKRNNLAVHKTSQIKSRQRQAENAEWKKQQKEHAKKHYLRNRTAIIAASRVRNLIRYQEITSWVLDHLKLHPCVDCGECNPLKLSFDHVRGEKQFNIGECARMGVSKPTLQAEIDKCEVRCFNCHMEKTAIERRYLSYLILTGQA